MSKKIFLFSTFLLVLMGWVISIVLKKPDRGLQSVDYILVKKSDRDMLIYHKGVLLRQYKIALGFSPVGAKTHAGDGKTPEGLYRITAKNPKSAYHLSLKISYPASKDMGLAKANGVDPGGDIMIHGLKEAFSFLGKLHILRDWTKGCIAISNQEIQELYPVVPVGTTVEIRP